MNLFIFLCLFLFKLIKWDIFIRFKKFLNSAAAYKFINRFIYIMTDETFKLLVKFTSISLKMEIPENIKLPEKFIIICNHQSLIDIPFIIYALPQHNVKFVARKGLSKYIPCISLSLRTGKHAVINQHKGLRETIKALVKLSRQANSEDICPLIFPEGTRSKTGKLGTFYNAAFRILCNETSLPVLSIALDGGYKLSRLYNVFNLSSKIELKSKILSLYDNPVNKEETDQMLKNIKSEIENQLSEWKKNDS